MIRLLTNQPVFDLPPELLATFSLKSAPVDAESVQENAKVSVTVTSHAGPIDKSSSLEDDSSNVAIGTTTSCSLCQVTSGNVQEQREHIRSDHHRYNLRAKLRGAPTFSETEFNQKIGEIDESLSGSDSSEESSDEDDKDTSRTDDDNTLAALLKRQVKFPTVKEEQGEVEQSSLMRHTTIWFSSSLFSSTISLGIYRVLFSETELNEPGTLCDSIRRKQYPSVSPQQAHSQSTSSSALDAQGPYYFLCMVGGGHFAAMVVSLVTELSKRPGTNVSNIIDHKPRVIAHKTIHRYTTRRKQGGAQSAMDNSKGPASTAGSSLRRHNEDVLRNEVRDLLGEWKRYINGAERLFIRATGKTNRSFLFSSDDRQLLDPRDRRLRGFPFSTKRATQSELMRAFTELTGVKVSRVDEVALAAAAEKQAQKAAEAEAERLRKSTIQKEKATPRLSPEEEEHMLHTTQIQALIRRSKIPALLSYISNNSIPPTFTFHPSPGISQKQQQEQPSYQHVNTPLHLAAHSSSPLIVDALLLKAHLDPTSTNSNGKTAFEIAGDRPTRDAFRVARHELGESAWDWNMAHIPPGVAREDVKHRAAAEKEAAEAAEKERRKAEIERLRREDEQKASEMEQRKNKGGRSLASTVEKSWTEKREEEMRGMTPEMRTRIERERRARAADERFRRAQQMGRGGRS